MSNYITETRDTGQLKRDNKTLYGYCVNWDTWSHNLGGFKERVKRTAITNEFLAQQDIYALLNHDKNKVLARSNKGKGSLKVKADDKGFYYEFKLKDNQLAKEVLQYIEDEELNESSYSFWITEGMDEWRKETDGIYYRTINQFRSIHDVSPVWTAANKNTVASTRFYLDNVAPILAEELSKKIDNKTEMKKIDQEQYYQQMLKKYLPEVLKPNPELDEFIKKELKARENKFK